MYYFDSVTLSKDSVIGFSILLTIIKGYDKNFQNQG